MTPTIKLVKRTIASLILALAIASPASGQQSGSTGRGGRTDPLQREMQRQLEREMMERALEAELSSPSERDLRLALAQIKEDFLRIQVVNHELMRAASRGNGLDLKLVAKSASEIKKRAERLKRNLVLPATEKRPKGLTAEAWGEPEQLRSSLSALDALILRFVSNPVFKSVTIVDAQLSAKARRDLEEIIELSSQLKKGSEQLHKAAQKSQ